MALQQQISYISPHFDYLILFIYFLHLFQVFWAAYTQIEEVPSKLGNFTFYRFVATVRQFGDFFIWALTNEKCLAIYRIVEVFLSRLQFVRCLLCVSLYVCLYVCGGV